MAVVGGAGYVGSAIAERLERMFDVTIVNNRPPTGTLATRHIDNKSCDIADYDHTKDALDGVEFVIHTAIVQIPKINEQKRLGYEVNIVGTQNVCRAVNEIGSIKGMILIGSWHVFGEHGISGVVNEEFGFRPDHVDERARLYALCKVGQEAITRIHASMSDKVYAVIRVGTVLGEGMPEKTAARIFITRGVSGQPLTPFKHDMHRPMLYVDINDVCRMCETYVSRVLEGTLDNLPRVVNLFWPEPVTIIDLAREIRDSVLKLSYGSIRPEIEVVDRGLPTLHIPDAKERIKADVTRALGLLDPPSLTRPSESIDRIVARYLEKRDTD